MTLDTMNAEDIRKAFNIPEPDPTKEKEEDTVHNANQNMNSVENSNKIINENNSNELRAMGSFVSDLNEFERYDMDKGNMNDPRDSNSNRLVKLHDELLCAIDDIINVKWSKSLQVYANNYFRMGIPNGNPYALPLTPENSFLPAAYFEVIKNPMDLSTIKNRVKDYFYDDISTFEQDLNLVIRNALQYHENSKDPMRRMAKAVAKRAVDVLNRAKNNLQETANE